MTAAPCAARHEHRRPPSTAHRQQPLQAASQDFALLRYARTHSGFVPTAAIAVRSCVVEHRKIAVQYLTSRSSLILTRARSMRRKSPRSTPFVIHHPERLPLDIARVRSMTILSRNATVWALDYQLGLLVLSQLAPTADCLPVVQTVGSRTGVCLNRPLPVGARLDYYLRLSQHAHLHHEYIGASRPTFSCED